VSAGQTMSAGLCTFQIGPYACALDVSHVREVIRPRHCTPVPHAPEGVVGLLSIRGRIITAYDLGPRLGLCAREKADAPFGILIDSDSAPLCLLVDAVGEVGQTSAERLEAPPSNLDEHVRPYVEAAYRAPRNLFLVLTAAAVRP